MDILIQDKVNQPQEQPADVSSKAPCSCGHHHKLIDKYTMVDGAIWWNCACGSTRLYIPQSQEQGN